MWKMVVRVLVLVMLAPLSGLAHATLIDFEDYAAGERVAEVSGARFSAATGVRAYDFGVFNHFLAHSGSKTVAPGGANFAGGLAVDFERGVTDLSFWSGGDDIAGKQASIDVYTGGAFESSVAMRGDGNFWTTDFHDLSAFANVTRIEIVNVRDPLGLVYDDFSFRAQAVPAPMTVGLIGVGLIGVGISTRRRGR
jgi:hypothetical protein